MSKPDWKDAPKWANWLAQDADGTWYWYSHEPMDDVLGDGRWTLPMSKDTGKYMRAGESAPPTLPLEPRPKS